MNTKHEILTFMRENLSFIKESFHVTKIGIFGSYARDEQTSTSDVDVLIELKEGAKDVHMLKNNLRNYLKNAFGKSVDLAREKYLKSYAKDAILQDVIYV